LEEMAVKDEAISSKVDEAATFRVNVKLVLARVVVRDSKGNALGNLHKEDFELFDNGKPQVISHFDAVLISTKHDAVNFRQLADWSALIVDTRNALAPCRVASGKVWKA